MAYIWEQFDFNGDAFDLLTRFRDHNNVFFLDSSQVDPYCGRYSFIGLDPFEKAVLTGPDALERLKETCRPYFEADAGGACPAITPFPAGIVGCVSYDYGLKQERIRSRAHDDGQQPDCLFAFYDCIVTIDHLSRKLIVTSSGFPETDYQKRQRRARQRLSAIVKEIERFIDGSGHHDNTVMAPVNAPPLTFECNFTREQYIRAVELALDHIGRGDIYQVNLSRRFRLDCGSHVWDPLAVYKNLRQLSPTCFGGYMDCGPITLISNSPERFLQLHGSRVQTRPMKGTRPRGVNAVRDRFLREEMLNSAKEKAELLMITDLLRNDLGRVCEYGSVAVQDMRTIEEYSYVFQATSTVEGDLRKDKDCFDLIRACFPGGSITGCPKIKAMEIIDDLEPTRRRMYTGAFGYISFAGDMDMNILIRTLVAAGDQLTFQVGAGIVADSVPDNEYQEICVKARAIEKCLQSCFAGGELVAAGRAGE